MTNPQELQVLLAAARADFASRLEAKIHELKDLSTRGDWTGARRAAHKLRGSAATYGFPKVGAAAAVLEEILIDAQPMPNEDARNRFVSALETARIESESATQAELGDR
jgi:HPt (histidine-containing phosphotransfer) domain-containing protein